MENGYFRKVGRFFSNWVTFHLAPPSTFSVSKQSKRHRMTRKGWKLRIIRLRPSKLERERRREKRKRRDRMKKKLKWKGRRRKDSFRSAAGEPIKFWSNFFYKFLNQFFTSTPIYFLMSLFLPTFEPFPVQGWTEISGFVFVCFWEFFSVSLSFSVSVKFPKIHLSGLVWAHGRRVGRKKWAFFFKKNTKNTKFNPVALIGATGG